MKHSIYCADRVTHLKIVAAALIAAIAVVAVGISVRLRSGEGDARTAGTIKARHHVTITSLSANSFQLPSRSSGGSSIKEL